MAKDKPTPQDKDSFEKRLERLRGIVDALERGEPLNRGWPWQEGRAGRGLVPAGERQNEVKLVQEGLLRNSPPWTTDAPGGDGMSAASVDVKAALACARGKIRPISPTACGRDIPQRLLSTWVQPARGQAPAPGAGLSFMRLWPGRNRLGRRVLPFAAPLSSSTYCSSTRAADNDDLRRGKPSTTRI
jgi:hypothetical protein